MKLSVFVMLAIVGTSIAGPVCFRGVHGVPCPKTLKGIPVSGIDGLSPERRASYGILDYVAGTVASGMVQTGWSIQTNALQCVHTPVCITQDEYDAQQAAIEDARITALVSVIGQQVTQIGLFCIAVDSPMPCEFDAVLISARTKIATLQSNGQDTEAISMAADAQMVTIIYLGLTQNGITDSDIYYVWERVNPFRVASKTIRALSLPKIW